MCNSISITSLLLFSYLFHFVLWAISDHYWFLPGSYILSGPQWSLSVKQTFNIFFLFLGCCFAFVVSFFPHSAMFLLMWIVYRKGDVFDFSKVWYWAWKSCIVEMTKVNLYEPPMLLFLMFCSSTVTVFFCIWHYS